MTDLDIQRNLQKYVGDRRPTSRYASFDYCFNHFQLHRAEDRLDELLEGETLQLSCLHLGFYLASWGMLRGSTELLQRSVKTFVPVVEALVGAPPMLWTLDTDGYTEDSIRTLLAFGSQLRASLHQGASDILVTKVLLGTLGCVPAFDTYFKRGFGMSTFGPKAVRKIAAFDQDHSAEIDSGREYTLDFDSGSPTAPRYSRAKVIDMIFFIQGGGF